MPSPSTSGSQASPKASPSTLDCVGLKRPGQLSGDYGHGERRNQTGRYWNRSHRRDSGIPLRYLQCNPRRQWLYVNQKPNGISRISTALAPAYLSPSTTLIGLLSSGRRSATTGTRGGVRTDYFHSSRHLRCLSARRRPPSAPPVRWWGWTSRGNPEQAREDNRIRPVSTAEDRRNRDPAGGVISRLAFLPPREWFVWLPAAEMSSRASLSAPQELHFDL
jgi:hypothetical protein